MLRLMAFCVMFGVSFWGRAETAPAPEQVIELELPTLEQFLSEFRGEFEKAVQEGRLKDARKHYDKICQEKVAEKTYCACLTKVIAEQSDEFLFYDPMVSLRFYTEMNEAHKMGKAYRYKRLLLQSTQRDSLNRRVALACGIVDEATKKIVPFKE